MRGQADTARAARHDALTHDHNEKPHADEAWGHFKDKTTEDDLTKEPNP